MVKTIRGAHADLRSVRAPASIRYVNVTGSKIESLTGIERFDGVHTIIFEKARTDDLRPLIPLKHQLRSVRILEPVMAADFDSISGLSELEELSIYLFDAADARHAAIARFELLPRLTGLWLVSKEDFGVDLAAAWLPQLSELERLCLVKLGIREQDTDAVCRAGPKLRLLKFRERSAAQTQRITEALGPGVADVWEPPEPSHGAIFEIDGTFSVSLSFPRFDNGLDRDIYAQRLLEGQWKDLADDLEMDPDADMISFYSTRRDVLEALVKRAAASRLI
jgi:hypothetical protein